jgi:hypothetical protein
MMHELIRFRRATPCLVLTSFLSLTVATRAASAQATSSSHATGVPTSQPAVGCQPSWIPTFGGGLGVDNTVLALTTFDDGGGSALYAGGTFVTAGGVTVNGIAKWNGSGWSSLAGGMSGGCATAVAALTVHDDGSGPALYAGGAFLNAGGVAARCVAKWDGSSWSPLGSGLSNGDCTIAVNALASYDSGSGPELYAGGTFFASGGNQVYYIARWNGSSWSAAGFGLGVATMVNALTVFDDGSGAALYAGGDFESFGYVAKWNGSSWSTLGSGVGGITYPAVLSLAAFDDGNGSALFAGGYFTMAGHVTANNIAKWNGSSWSAPGTGMPGQYSGSVSALTVFDDGSGPALYAGGKFTSAGGVATAKIAKWNGSNWSPLGSGIFGSELRALAVSDTGGGPALFAGGQFVKAIDSGDAYLAQWAIPTGCGAPGNPICEPGAGGVIVCPCGNAPSANGLGCNNSSNTGGAQLAATGIARLSYDTVEFTTSGEKPTATSIVLQGDNESAAGVSFGQGVRCVAGALKRLYVKSATAGSITAPQGTDLHVHARSASLGDPIAPGTHRYYGVYYRDPTVLGGCPAASTFNITQQLDVLWGA